MVIAGTVDIQGLIAIAPNDDMNAVYISWMCCSPDNNKHLGVHVRYSGVGGHLFAIAVRKSVEYGYDGNNAKNIMEVYDYEWVDEEL